MNCNTTHYRANSSSVPGDPTLFQDTGNIAGKILWERFGAQVNSVEVPTKPLAEVPADAKHLVFVTHFVHAPDFGGVEGADAICVEAGKTVDESREWVALISASTVHARDRVEIKGPIYNLMAQHQGADAETFWGAGEGRPYVRYTEKGFDTHDYVIPAFKITIDRVWTGSTAAGRYHAEKGACKDWTSKLFDDRAAAGESSDNMPSWFELEGETSCSHYARLYCMSR